MADTMQKGNNSSYENDGYCQYTQNSFYKKTIAGQIQKYNSQYEGDSRVDQKVPSDMHGDTSNIQSGP